MVAATASSSTRNGPGPGQTISEIRAEARELTQRIVRGASAQSALASARKLADAGKASEDAGDYPTALYQYMQAAA